MFCLCWLGQLWGAKFLFHFLALPIAWQHTPKAPNLRGITPQRPLDNWIFLFLNHFQYVIIKGKVPPLKAK